MCEPAGLLYTFGIALMSQLFISTSYIESGLMWQYTNYADIAILYSWFVKSTSIHHDWPFCYFWDVGCTVLCITCLFASLLTWKALHFISFNPSWLAILLFLRYWMYCVLYCVFVCICIDVKSASFYFLISSSTQHQSRSRRMGRGGWRRE